MRHVSATTLMLLTVTLTSCGSHQEPGVVTPGADAGKPSAGQVQALDSVPKQFLGRWAGTPALCDDPSSDTDAMVVESKQILFWESSGQVLGVVPQGNLQITIRIEYSDNNYDEEELKSTTLDFTLKLSADQRNVTTIENGKSKDVRHRCPPKSQEGAGEHAA